MATPKGLGRGFDSLIPKDLIQEEFDPTADQERAISRTKKVLISDIIPNPEQPRRAFDKNALQELADSIKQHGVLQPVIVIKTDGKYQLVAGERRWRAAEQAGLESIPALVRSLDDQQRLEMAIIENIQREDLGPLELATAFLKLNKQFNITTSKIGKRIGKAHSTVNNIIRLLDLPGPAKRALQSGKISEGHARAILVLRGDARKQQELLDLILRHKWTVRKAEQFAAAYREGATDQTTAARRTLEETDETKRIAKRFKTPVKIQTMAKGGRLIIEYKDDTDFKRITKKMLG